MNISAFTTSSASTTATNTSADQTTSDLEKKIDELYNKIKQENASKDDAKTKKTKVKAYEDQIQEVEAEISQKEMRQQNQARKAGQNAADSKNDQKKQTTADGYDASSIVEYLRRNTANELFDVQG